MPNIGPIELLLICIVALVVIGPERLPAAVKTASLWIGRFRRSFYKVKAEIERELNADEIRRQLHNESVLEEIEAAKSEVAGIAKDTQESVNKIVNSKTFDPGAAKESLSQSETEDGKSLKQELEEAGEQVKGAASQVQEAARQVYGSGNNPKLAQQESDAVNSLENPSGSATASSQASPPASTEEAPVNNPAEKSDDGIS